MNYLTSLFNWIKENYIKVSIIFILISLLYFSFIYWNHLKDQKAENSSQIYINLFNKISEGSEISLADHKEALLKIEAIDPNSIYYVFTKSLEAKFLADEENLIGAIESYIHAKNILDKKGSDFNFLSEIINLRLVQLYIQIENYEAAKSLLSLDFITYGSEKYIFLGDILKNQNDLKSAREFYDRALELSVDQAQETFIKLKISNLN
tara:strand:- start:2721 stop:3344 length:624 start_codon:yes stop_codon:yes gene_type:complete